VSSIAPFVYDPYTRDFLDDPYRYYAYLRQNDPVHYAEKYGFWLLSRYDDCAAALMDTGTFSSRGGAGPNLVYLEEVSRVDPPQHRRLHGVIRQAVAPPILRRLREEIPKIATRLVDGFAADGATDLIGAFAQRLPLTVIASLLGVPDDDAPMLKRWGDMKLLSIGGDLEGEQKQAVEDADASWREYFGAQLEQRHAKPRNDFLTTLAAAERDGTLSHEETLAMCSTLMTGGHETTTNLIGNGMLVLLQEEHENLRAKLAATPKLAPKFIEEVLRYEPPVQGLFRLTTKETTVAGMTIPPKRKVQILFASANRDEAYVPDGETFDPFRAKTKHLSFAMGPHFCIGAKVARLEGEVALQTLFHRLPSLELAFDGEAPDWQEVFMFRGLERLPVRWDAEAAAARG
jgi:cytochrome P450